MRTSVGTITLRAESVRMSLPLDIQGDKKENIFELICNREIIRITYFECKMNTLRKPDERS